MTTDSSSHRDGVPSEARLHDELSGGPMKPGRFLSLAIRIAAAVADIHRRHIIHKNITPETILLDARTGEVTVGDFSLASRLPVEYPTRKSLYSLGGQMAYMSPEMTGRVNRVVDYRTDLYSLGVVFYEMLTGSPPFHADDVLEWVHCHIARTPPAPADLVPDIGPTLSAIVMKLLAKNAEERYQTALGLQSDLKRCLALLNNTGEIASFAVGENDIPDRLLIPQKLYGRENDIRTLRGIFSTVVDRGSTALVMVAGYSGIGKTSLVRELYKPVVEAGGFFVSGKFDQYKRNIPYLTIAEAFRELIQQILTEAEENIALWRKKFEGALSVNARLVTDVIPLFELIVGKQPPMEDLPPSEAQNRFNMVFRQFIGVFTTKEHPLTLFLDDLQWVDPASLKLISDFISHPETRYLLLIGAYRDNEVTPSHPLMLALDEMGKNRTNLHTITLAPLSRPDLGRLLSDTLRCLPARAEQLTGLVYRKTAGNPFFSIQFLMMLYDENLVNFDEHNACWRWDIEQITAQGYTDNVVDLVVAKLRKLSIEAQDALKLAACIGNTFDLHALSAISAVPVVDLRHHLWQSLQEGLVLLADEPTYAFLHDRVQQAAYSLIPEAKRREVHLQIGRLMLTRFQDGDLDERIFDIVHQFNLGSELLADKKEKYQVAELNLLAGRKARASTAYAAALAYLLAAVDLLGDGAWQDQYTLTFAIHKELAVVEYLNSNYSHARDLIDLLLQRAGSDLERAELYNILIVQYTLTANYRDAIQSGQKALRLLHIKVPETGLEKELTALLAQNEGLLGDREISSLIDEPEMSDPEKIVSLELLSNMVVPARYTDSTLFALVTVLNVNISLRFGLTAKSTVGYTAYGMVLNSVMGRYKEALEYGELSLKLSERFGAPTQKCQACFMIGHYLNHWVRHLKYADETLSAGIQAGLSSGEMQWTGYIFAYKLFQPFYRGIHLDLIKNEIPSLLFFTRKTQNQWATDTLLGLQLAIALLTSDQPEEPDEQEYFMACQEHRSFGAKGRYAVMRTQIHYLYGQLDKAMEAVKTARELGGFYSSSISVAELAFYHSLILASLCDHASGEKKEACLAAIQTNLEQIRIWKVNCPDNFTHLFLIVEAELARLDNREQTGEQLYEQAIGAATEGGFIQDTALACELASRFYRQRGIETAADAYLQKARNAYKRWGAMGKVRQIDGQFPRLAELDRNGADLSLGVSTDQLDSVTLVKASQAIFGNIHLPDLLDTMMRIVMENAGAQRGCLILSQGEEWSIAATARVKDVDILVSKESSVLSPSLVPLSLINYVLRTRENIILEDASTSSLFSPDEYIARQRPLSLLCLPILRQSALLGLLYLENNLATGVFTKDRVAVLELLASLSAISLENALLFADLRQENQERKKAQEALRESEKRLAGIIDFLPDATFAVDREGKVIAWNRAMEEMSGIPADRMIGTTGHEYALPFYGERRPLLIDMVAASDEEIKKQYLSVERKGNALLGEVKVTLRGRQRTLSGIAAPLYDEAGNVVGAIESVRDVTERKHFEEENKRLAMILEQAAEGIILTDTNWVIQYANPAFERITGYARDEIIGRRTTLLKSDVHDNDFFGNIRGTLSRGETWSGRITNKRKDGSLYEVDATGSPFRDETGKIVSFIGIQHDITNEIKLERQLRQSQKMEAIGTLAGGIAHDFNNILTAIIGYTQLLTYKVPSDSPLLPPLHQVLQASNRAADLVKQVLAFSRQSEHERQPVMICGVVKEVLKLLRSSLPTTIEIRKDIAVAAQECIVLADETQIHQVIMNLCTNAAHAMHDRGGVLEISVTTFEADAALAGRYHGLRAGRYVGLKVSDTGHGMDATTMEHIFDPYYTTKPKGEGTGLGLAVVQGIVKNHDGIITVYSEPGKGSTFSIFLPRLEEVISREVEEIEGLVGGDEHILFVDDEDMLVETGKQILESLGYGVTETTSSSKALDIFRAQPATFDLVITDMTMPEFTGLELASQMLSLRPDIPVILCSGFCGDTLREQAWEIGIREIVMKPYDIKNLAEIIRGIFR
jgi:PAS domain S-box-containing protein